MASERPLNAVSFGTETAANVAISPSNGPGDHAACDAEIARLEEHVRRLGREHARHSTAVSAHKARADQQESRAIRAEGQLARFLEHAEEYDRLAGLAAMSRRNADLVAELRRRIAVLERKEGRYRTAEATLTAIADHCRKHAEHAQLHCPDLGRPAEALVKADAILAIISTEEEPS